MPTEAQKIMKAEDLIAPAVAAELQSAADNPRLSLQRADVPRVAAGLIQAVAPLIQHATNAEPWYQSRVTWGVILAGLSTIAKPLVGELPISAEQTVDIVNALATAGQAFGFGLTLYGRWRAKRPIGR